MLKNNTGAPGRTVVKSHIQGHSAVQPAFLTHGFLRHPGAIVQPKSLSRTYPDQFPTPPALEERRG